MNKTGMRRTWPNVNAVPNPFGLRRVKSPAVPGPDVDAWSVQSGVFAALRD